MTQTVNLILNSEDRSHPTVIATDRNRPLKHIQRARIILLSADRLLDLEVTRQAEVSRPAVWRRQVRYAEQGVDGLLRDNTRKPGRAPLSTATVANVLALTCSDSTSSKTSRTF